MGDPLARGSGRGLERRDRMACYLEYVVMGRVDGGCTS